MRTWTETHREGTDMGPIDWNHKWFSETKLSLALLKEVEADPGAFQATTDGGWPRIGWRKVLAFRMYDGWPHWNLHPAMLTLGPLGGEWHSLNSITGIERLTASQQARAT